MSDGGAQFRCIGPFFDSNGNIYRGIKLYHYAAGTTNNKDIWTDEGKTTTAAQPLVDSDNDGIVTFYGDGDYRLQVKDSAGADLDVAIDWDKVRVTSDTATMWENNSGTAWPAASAANRWQLAALVDGANNFLKLGINNGAGFKTLVEKKSDDSTYIFSKIEANEVSTKLPWVNVSHSAFGAVGDGVSDDTVALQAALDSLGTTGGICFLEPDGKYLVDSANLNVPDNVTLMGHMQTVGNRDKTAATSYGSSVYLNTTYTININKNSSIKGIGIFRKGINFSTEVDETSFAGTAITIIGAEAYIGYCGIFGFNKAITNTGNMERCEIEHIKGDNIYGIEATGIYGIWRITDVHFWPYVTIDNTSADNTRSGYAFYFHDVFDWGKLTNCFSYGYLNGFRLVNANSVTLLGCGADDTGSHTSSIGAVVDGISGDCVFIGCQFAAKVRGVDLLSSRTAGKNVHIYNSTFWGNSDHDIIVQGGDAHILGSNLLSSAATANLTINNASSKVFVDGNTFANATVPIRIANGINTTDLILGKNQYNTSPAIVEGGTGTFQLKTVASASSIALPPDHNGVHVSGTTTITAITGGWAGRKVTLIFDGILTVTDGTGLNLAGNFVTSANDVLCLVHDGAGWYEVSRSVN